MWKNRSGDGILGYQINKRLESLIHAIHSQFYWRIFKKTILFSGFKTLTKIRKTRKLGSIHEYYFVERKMRVENQTKTRV
jgi:hypothetical protein